MQAWLPTITPQIPGCTTRGRSAAIIISPGIAEVELMGPVLEEHLRCTSWWVTPPDLLTKCFAHQAPDLTLTEKGRVSKAFIHGPCFQPCITALLQYEYTAADNHRGLGKLKPCVLIPAPSRQTINPRDEYKSYPRYLIAIIQDHR